MSTASLPEPMKAIGIEGTHFIFHDRIGQKRAFSQRSICCRPSIVSLFGGDINFLKEHFPKKSWVKEALPDGRQERKEVITDFNISQVADWLISLCFIQVQSEQKIGRT